MQGQYRLLVGHYDGAQTAGDEAVIRLLRESQNSSFKTLERGSHFAPMEHPDLVLREIRDYLDSEE